MRKDRKVSEPAGRRDFLKLATLGAATGAAVAASGAKPVVAAAEAAPKGGAYRETEHIRKYYKSARF